MMKRRDFLKTGAAMAAIAELGSKNAGALVPAHNWDKFDFGSGPRVTDRLNQGPFPQYAPYAVIPSDEVVMSTTPSEDVVANYGMGLVTCTFRWGKNSTFALHGGKFSRSRVNCNCRITSSSLLISRRRTTRAWGCVFR
jgi:hypothetical protein